MNDEHLSNFTQHKEGGIGNLGKPTSLTLDLPKLLWSGHQEKTDLFFEVQKDKRNRQPPVSYEDALAALDTGEMRFFGVVPRKSPGNRKLDCVDRHNVLHADVDRGPTYSVDDLLEEISPSLLTLGLWPSTIVYSGRAGFHLYWILDRLLPIEEIQGYSKALGKALKGDSCWNCDRILRVPETLNEKEGGGRVEVVEMSGEILETGRLSALGAVKPIDRLPSRRIPHAKPEAQPEWFRASEGYDWAEIPLDLGAILTDQMGLYLRALPARGWRPWGKSRSEVEMSITYRMASRGASDRQIKDLADWGFARHIEEQELDPTAPDIYLELTIDNARRRLFEHRGLVSSPLGGWPRRRDPKKRHQTRGELEHILRSVGGQKRSELAKEIQIGFGRSRGAAYNDINGLLGVGLIEVRDHRVYRTTGDPQRAKAPGQG
jgi:hypothetical protein